MGPCSSVESGFMGFCALVWGFKRDMMHEINSFIAYYLRAWAQLPNESKQLTIQHKMCEFFDFSSVLDEWIYETWQQSGVEIRKNLSSRADLSKLITDSRKSSLTFARSLFMSCPFWAAILSPFSDTENFLFWFSSVLSLCCCCCFSVPWLRNKWRS